MSQTTFKNIPGFKTSHVSQDLVKIPLEAYGKKFVAVWLLAGESRCNMKILRFCLKNSQNVLSFKEPVWCCG